MSANQGARGIITMIESGDYASAAREAESLGYFRLALYACAKGGMRDDVQRLIRAATEGQIPSEHILDEANARLFSDAGLGEERASVYEGIGIARQDASYLRKAFDVYRELGRDGLGEYRQRVEGLVYGNPITPNAIAEAGLLGTVDDIQPLVSRVYGAVANARMYFQSGKPEHIKEAKRLIDEAYGMGSPDDQEHIHGHKVTIDEAYGAAFGE